MLVQMDSLLLDQVLMDVAEVPMAHRTCSNSSGTALPNSAYPPLIAPFWTDLNPSAGSIKYATIGPNGNRTFIVQYTNVPHYPNVSPVTFQVKLSEFKGKVQIVYQTTSATYSPITIGIQDSLSAGKQYANQFYNDANINFPNWPNWFAIQYKNF